MSSNNATAFANSNDVVHVSSTSDGFYTTIKRDNTTNNNGGPPVTFYHSLELQQQQQQQKQQQQHKSNKKKKSRTSPPPPPRPRRVHVGDVVVLNCPSDDDCIPYPPPCSNNGGGRLGNTGNKNNKKKDCLYPFPSNQPWKVGVILALYGTMEKKIVDASTGSRLVATEVFKMTIMWLHRDVHLPQNRLGYNTQLKNRLRDQRRNFLLFESTEEGIQQGIPVSRIIPQCFIKLLANEGDAEPNDDIVEVEDEKNGRMILQFCCRYRFKDSQLSSIERTMGWEDLYYANQSTDDEPPAVLTRLWQLLPNFQWNNNGADHPEWIKAHTNIWKQESKSRLQYHEQIEKEISGEVEEQEEEEEEEEEESPPTASATASKKVTAKTKKTAAPSPAVKKGKAAAPAKKGKAAAPAKKGKAAAAPAPQKNAKKTTTTATTKPKPVKAKASKPSAKVVSKAKASKKKEAVKKAAPTRRKPAPEEDTKPKSKKTQAKKKAPTAKKDNKKTKRESTSSKSEAAAANNNKKSRRNSSKAAESAVAAAVAASSSSMEESVAASSGVSARGDRVNFNGSNFSYYNSVNVPLGDNMKLWHHSQRINHNPDETWILNVGDIVAVQNDQSNPPPHLLLSADHEKPTTKKQKQNNNNRKKKVPEKFWFPYRVSWCPAMVMAIYENPNPNENPENPQQQREPQMEMLLRWFVRYTDLNLYGNVQERLDEKEPDIATELKTVENMVIETNMVQEYPIQFALGKLDIVPYNKTKDTAATAITTTTTSRFSSSPTTIMPPSLVLRCAYQFNETQNYQRAKLGTFFRKAPDWGNYYNRLDKGGFKPWFKAAKEDHKGDIPFARYRAFLKTQGIAAVTTAEASTTTTTLSVSSSSSSSSSVAAAAAPASATDASTSNNTSVVDMMDVDVTTTTRKRRNDWDLEQWKLPYGEDGHSWCLNDEEADVTPFDPLSLSKPLVEVEPLPSDKNHPAGPITSFWDSLKLPLLTCRYAKEAAERTNKELLQGGCRAPTFHVEVGDVVCVARTNETTHDGMNYPYRGPWKVGQVVAIYSRGSAPAPMKTRKRKSSSQQHPTTKNENVFVEIRWLPLVGELPPDWQHNLVVNGSLGGYVTKNKTIQGGYVSQITMSVLESDMIERDVPIAQILGSVDLMRQKEGGNLVELSSRAKRKRQKAPGGPIIRCNILSYWYWSAHHAVEQIYLPSLPGGTDEAVAGLFLERFLERCYKVSSALSLYPQLLADAAPTYARTQQEALINGEATAAKWIKLSGEIGEATKEYYQAVELAPRWELYQHPLCAVRDRLGLSWKIHVGDVIAVKTTADNGDSDNANTIDFPCKMPYRIVQVVAMFKDTATDRGIYHLELRRFQRRERESSSASSLAIETVHETDEIFTVEWLKTEKHPSTIDIISPVVLHPSKLAGQNQKQQATMTLWSVRYLPSVSLQYGGRVSDAQNARTPFSLRGIAERGIRLASSYTSSKARDLATNCFVQRYQQELHKWESNNVSRIYQDAFKLPASSPSRANLSCLSPAEESNSSEETLQEARIHLLYEPIHIDRSSKRAYYNKISIEPGYGNFAVRLEQEDRNQLWDVKLGDIIVAHYGRKSSGPAYFEPNTLENRIRPRVTKPTHPYTIPWAVAEVLCIWKVEADEEGSGTGSPTSPQSPVSENGKGGVHLEVRWLYRKNELPGYQKGADKKVVDVENLEELIESDHVDDIEAVSLLSPANLHYSRKRPYQSQFNIGMPVLDFFCIRFFSIVRRSIVACGGLDGRLTRGKSHSKYIKEDAVLRELIGADSQKTETPTSDGEPVKRQDAFLEVIKKLSLTDASKEASESVMIGRDQEKMKILSFLRSAIKGGADEKGSSMFVAGPPGVGKTGCIRAAIAKLQRAQALGQVPAFRFISLNGMEMRHPFEAYTRLLEALKGGMKVRKSDEEAASALETYFTKPVSEKDKDKDKKEEVVTVVLLDEIDYLVTQKQTVMYNFFDWPRRSAALCDSGVRGRRLVVIGVSNTLNLPERLQPRVQSRIGDRRCYFKSYNAKEIQSILTAKIEEASPNLQVFDKDAIVFASRKTAAVSGDVRRAFQTCRSAAELVLNRIKAEGAVTGTSQREGKQKGALIVRIPDVQKVSREASDSGEAKAVAHSSPFEALLIVSLAHLSRSTGRESKGFDIEEIIAKMEAISGALGDDQYAPPPRLDETLFLLNRLAEANLVELETPRNASLSFCATPAGIGGAWPITTPLVAEHNLFLALRNTKHNALAQKYLSKAAF